MSAAAGGARVKSLFDNDSDADDFSSPAGAGGAAQAPGPGTGPGPGLGPAFGDSSYSFAGVRPSASAISVPAKGGALSSSSSSFVSPAQSLSASTEVVPSLTTLPKVMHSKLSIVVGASTFAITLSFQSLQLK